MKLLSVVLLFTVIDLTAADRPVAITFDDLPRGGDGGSRTLDDIRAMTGRLLRPFRDRSIPVIGFVNQGRQVDFGPEGLRQILDLWLDSGADLGNHSYSHLNINNVPLDEYTADIIKGEPSFARPSPAVERPFAITAIRSCSPARRPKSRKRCKRSWTAMDTR